jgi:hypothetical protein
MPVPCEVVAFELALNTPPPEKKSANEAEEGDGLGSGRLELLRDFNKAMDVRPILRGSQKLSFLWNLRAPERNCVGCIDYASLLVLRNQQHCELLLRFAAVPEGPLASDAAGSGGAAPSINTKAHTQGFSMTCPVTICSCSPCLEVEMRSLSCSTEIAAVGELCGFELVVRRGALPSDLALDSDDGAWILYEIRADPKFYLASGRTSGRIWSSHREPLESHVIPFKVVPLTAGCLPYPTAGLFVIEDFPVLQRHVVPVRQLSTGHQLRVLPRRHNITSAVQINF